MAGLPAVGRIGNKHFLVISVVLQNSVDLVVAHGVLVVQSLRLNGSAGADNIIIGVVLTVVVIPCYLAVALVSDGIHAVVGVEGRLPNLGAVVKGLDAVCIIVTPFAVEEVVVDQHSLKTCNVGRFDVHNKFRVAVLGKVDAG